MPPDGDGDGCLRRLPPVSQWHVNSRILNSVLVQLNSFFLQTTS